MSRKLQPLKFNPALLDKDWGSEAWLISSMGEGLEGEASAGFLAGNTLSEILETYMGELAGDKVFEFCHLQFPVLIKTLEVNGCSPLEVHPDDGTALERYDDCGKEEVWYILKADSNSRIYLGFNEDSDASQFYGRCSEGTVEGMLNTITPVEGELYHISPGTVHSCRGGMTILEIQQPSYQTLRLFDRNRNNPRSCETDLEEALDIIDYGKYDIASNRIGKLEDGMHVFGGEHFTISGIVLEKEETVEPDDSGSFIIYICVGGSALLCDGAGNSLTLGKGEPVLIPASADELVLKPSGGKATLLKVTMGDMEENDNYIK